MLKLIQYPKENSWGDLVKRPVKPEAELESLIRSIFEEVQKKGDRALKTYSEKFDGVKLNSLDIAAEEIGAASEMLDAALKKAIKRAAKNIEKFHLSQRENVSKIETSPGVICWRESRAIESVGIYIPGGSAPLFSTVLMLGVPAKIAGCSEVVLCTPPSKNGKINPAILFAAELVGVTKVITVGGAQAIAALTFGTDSVPKVSKIFGPGNQFVTAAKQVSQRFGVAIDMPAGPSEVLILADDSADAEFVAADLLSQAEHGSDSQVILVSTSVELIRKVQVKLKDQLTHLPRKELAQDALKNSKAILFRTANECIQFSNLYAPEHLIIAMKYAEKIGQRVMNAGSVFLGNYSCESAGDYASGTNHTLPTNGYSKSYSGVSLDSFVKKITFQKISRSGIADLGPTIEKMAEAEQLFAHKNAVSIRLKKVKK